MANHKPNFKLVTKNIVYVKPPNPSFSSITLSLSALDNRPDLDYVTQVVYVYQSTNHDSLHYFTPIDPAFVIKEALSKALLYYYPFAGRLVKKDNDGNFQIHFNPIDCGVPFLEADADCHLSSLNYLDGNNVQFAKHLVYDPPLEDNKNINHYPLVIKLTKFLCGGFTIGLGLSHHICDGFGGSQFYKAMIELARGNSEPSVKPVWGRERLAGSTTKLPFQPPMDIASAAVSPLWPSATIMHECFEVDLESIRRLKMRLMKESSSGIEFESMEEEKSFTTFEALGACVWRSRARALQLKNEGKSTILAFPLDMRGHLDPPLPNGYYGNASFDAYFALNVRELNEMPLLEVMKVIKDTKKAALTTDSIKNKINTIYPSLEYFDQFGPAFTSLIDWRHLGVMENVDFAGCMVVNMVPVPCKEAMYECLILPPSKMESSMKGGVRIFLSLPSVGMIKFRQEMEDMDILIKNKDMLFSTTHKNILFSKL